MRAMVRKDLRDLSPQDQAQAARKCFSELSPQRSVEFLTSAPLYGLCTALLEGGQKFSWKRLDEKSWRIAATKAPYPSLNSVPGVHHPAALGESATLCVTDREERVWLIDGDRSRTVADVVAGAGASHLAVHPEGHIIYVGCPGSGEVAVIDAHKREKLASIPVGKNGQLPNFSPDGRFAAIDCGQTNDVYLIDAKSHRAIFTQTVGTAPHECVFTPDGRFLCVPCASGELYLIPPENPDRALVLRCGFGAGHIDFTGDGRTAYVANSLDDDVAVVDLAAEKIVARIPAGAGAHRPTLSEDGNLLFVANFVADTVTVIDTRSRQVAATVPVGTYPHDVARAPGGRLAVSSYGAGSCTFIDPANGMASAELKTGRGTSHCAFLPGGELGFFANSISKDMAVVDLENNAVRASLPVGARASGVNP